MDEWERERPLHERKAQEYADEFATHQRQAYLQGFEDAVEEAETFELLREWLASERDLAAERHADDDSMEWFQRRQMAIDTLVKLSQIGCRPDSKSANDD